ncbi:MAG: hypothetical protein GF398_02290 [Chitinivibrionales bacterium]|nr:hypothetical protein [Chitinivibrionales bacterium]
MSDHSHSLAFGSYARLGILLTVIGVILAFDTLTDLSYLYRFWPLLVTILGIGFIGIYVRRSRKEAVYIGIGTYLISFSGLALYCSLTSWTALADLWPLFITMLGVATLSGYLYGNREPVVLLTGLLFMSLSILFLFVFGTRTHLWWTVFILAGVSFFIFDKVRQS